jgi:thiamine biosynthesis lipoprotein
VTSFDTEPKLHRDEGFFRGSFGAMASPCEVLVRTADEALARRLTNDAARECRRIEAKFSRYRDGSELSRINASAGSAVRVDDETAQLLDFASSCVTSGVLRRVWTFDGSGRLPSPDAVSALLPLVGWHRVSWTPPELLLPAGMEIDFGGIGKEYAVDCAFALLAAQTSCPFLVNFGGDLRAGATSAPAEPWTVGVENPSGEGDPLRALPLSSGALATSGDARRFLLVDGMRYGHVLDPTTGWPVRDAPRSVTVHAPTCTEAGTFATLALLAGAHAERFLAEQGLSGYWIVR